MRSANQVALSSFGPAPSTRATGVRGASRGGGAPRDLPGVSPGHTLPESLEGAEAMDDVLSPDSSVLAAEQLYRQGGAAAQRATVGARRGPVRRRYEAAAPGPCGVRPHVLCDRSEENTSKLQSLMRIRYAVFCL